MFWLIGAVIVAGLLIWLFLPGKPSPNLLESPAELVQALEYLRDRGVEGAELRIQVRDDPDKHVRVTKTILGPNAIQLHGSVSSASMHPANFAALRQALTEASLPHSVADVGGITVLTVSPFEDIKAADHFIRSALTVGYGAHVEGECEAAFKNVLIWNLQRATGVARAIV